MSRKPLEHLSATLAAERQNVEQLMEKLIGLGQPALRTREWVLPRKDSAILEWLRQEKHNRHRLEQAESQPNRLIRGDDLHIMAALVAEKDANSALRGKIDLICIDSPFPSGEIGYPFAPGFERSDDFLQHMAGITLRLLLAQRLLSDQGIFCMRLDRRILLHAEAIIADNFDHRSLVCRAVRDDISRSLTAAAHVHGAKDIILFCSKDASTATWKSVFRQFDDQRR
jgi:hypothetical protein